MRWSWKLGRFAGIDTYVHATFPLLVGYAALVAWSGAGTLLAVMLGVGFLVAVFGSVLLHELGHALVARHYGIATHRIVLSPIGGIAQLDGMPSRPREELAVALAGPAVNFALAASLWLVAPMFGAGLLGSLVGNLVGANLILGLFNLVPAFPMDGGRALRAFLAERVGSRRATETAARVGKVVAVLMGLYGLFAGPWMLVLIAGFVWFAANAELSALRYGGSTYADEVEVLGAPRRARWTDRFGGWVREPTWEVPRPHAGRRAFRDRGWVGPAGSARGPIRVILLRRGWF